MINFWQVRVVLSGTYPIAEMSNKTMRAAWIQEQLQKVHDNFADGINIDMKDHIQSGMNDSQLLTDFMTEVYSAFKSANKAYQVILIRSVLLKLKRDVRIIEHCCIQMLFTMCHVADWCDVSFNVNNL